MIRGVDVWRENVRLGPWKYRFISSNKCYYANAGSYLGMPDEEHLGCPKTEFMDRASKIMYIIIINFILKYNTRLSYHTTRAKMHF